MLRACAARCATPLLHNRGHTVCALRNLRTRTVPLGQKWNVAETIASRVLPPPRHTTWARARLHTSRRALASAAEDEKNSGTLKGMPEPIPLPPFVLAVLRGMGQVVFCNSTFSGALITAGLAFGDPQLAGLALLGCTSATATGKLLGADIGAGLLGYNGALVGCAFSVFLGYSLPVIAAWVVGGSCCSALIAWKLGALTAPIPQWTWAFNIVALTTLGTMKAPPAPVESAPPLRFGMLDPIDWLDGIFSGISQIFVVNNGISGALILAGIAVYSPYAAAATFVGSVIGALTGFAFASDAAEVEDGLWGFNPALTALAVSIFFVPLGGAYGLLLCGSAAAAAITTIGMKAAVFSAIQTPSLTLPFCTIASACFLLGGRVPGLVRARAPHSPEINLQAHRGLSTP